jgi:hypothetical protein
MGEKFSIAINVKLKRDEEAYIAANNNPTAHRHPELHPEPRRRVISVSPST